MKKAPSPQTTVLEGLGEHFSKSIVNMWILGRVTAEATAALEIPQLGVCVTTDVCRRIHAGCDLYTQGSLDKIEFYPASRSLPKQHFIGRLDHAPRGNSQSFPPL